MGFVEIFKCLGDESRLRILHALHQGYFNVGELTSILGISQSTVSHHLKTLVNNDLVKSQKEGTWVYYTTKKSETSPYSLLQDFFASCNEHNDPCLQGLFAKDYEKVDQILNHRRDKARDYFDSVAKEWKFMRDEAGGSESYLDKLVDLIPDEVSLLDLGCGSGALLEKIVPRSGVTMGVDYSTAMLEVARNHLGEHAARVDLRLGKLEHLPLGDDTVDLAIAYMVFHHIPEPLQALQDIRRVLRPGGRLILVDLTRHENEYMRERYADLWLGFEPEKIVAWGKEAGFRHVSTEIFGKDDDVFFLNLDN